MAYKGCAQSMCQYQYGTQSNKSDGVIVDPYKSVGVTADPYKSVGIIPNPHMISIPSQNHIFKA